MDGTTVFDGFARAGGAHGGGGGVAARDRGQVRREPELRDQAVQRWRQQGTVQPDRIGGSKRSTLAAHAERVHALLATEPDLTIAELRTRLTAAGIAVSRSAVDRFLAAAGLTRKKRPSAPPSKTGQTSPPPGAPGARGSRR